jgi:hypothetical protein
VRFQLGVLQVMLIAVPVVFLIREARLRARGPDWEIVPGDSPTPPVSERKFSCIGTSKGNVHGNCAESWWDHFWNDRPYCSDVKFWCELAGGTFTKD